MLKRTLTCSRQVADSRDPCPSFRSCFGGTAWTFRTCETGERCKGSKRVSLSSNEDFPDCAIASGMDCMETTTDSARACCASRECPIRTCDGTVATYCEAIGPFPDPGWVLSELDCNLVGQLCVADKGGVPCEAPGPACDGPLESCQGSINTYCMTKQAQVDCSKNPFRTACGLDPSGAMCRVAGAECTPEGFVDSCDQGKLTVCVNGYKKTLDCRSIGFEICQPVVPTPGFHARCGYFE